MYDLTVVIPGNNEMFMARTIEDILKNKRAKTQIIAVLDGGKWANPPIKQHPDVNVIFIPDTIGQRAATNVGVRLSRAKYIMKLDAHCAWDEGHDQKMLEAFESLGEEGKNVTMVGVMRNLWAFQWKCYHCGWTKYQSPTPIKCGNPNCGKEDKIRRDMKWSTQCEREDVAHGQWKSRHSPRNYAYAFDSEPHYQTFQEYRKRPEYLKALEETGLTESMSLQGSAFMCTREKYWELNLSDESVGSWGNQGIEVACKTWLSGGRVLVNHKTWYAHMFRTQGGDFGFPYDQSGSAIEKAKKKVWDFFFDGKFKQQIHPVSWLIEKFWPIMVKNDRTNEMREGWTKDDLARIKQREQNK